MMNVGFIHAQDLLGKTKAQAKVMVSKKIAPRSFSEGVGTTPTLGYDKWWYASKVDPQYLCYFDNKGVCFLECVMTKDFEFVKLALGYYKNHTNFYIYGNDNPEITNGHKFIEGKTSIEVTANDNPLLKDRTFYIWSFKLEHKQEVLRFFNKYYSE